MNKEELIIDLIAHPEHYSEQQIQEILSDDESLAAYTALLEARMAIDKDSAEKVDIAIAWRNFAAQNADLLEQHRTTGNSMQQSATMSQHTSLHILLMKWRKIAAMFVVTIAMSGLAYAAIHTLTADRYAQKTDVENIQAAQKVGAAAAVDTASIATGKNMAAKTKAVFRKTFENVALETMLQEMANYYGMSVKFDNQDARCLRYYYEWNSANAINSVIDELNHSQQVNIIIEGDKIVVE